MEMTVRILRAEAQVSFEVRQQSDIGECRRTASRLAQTGGFNQQEVGKVSIVATELAANLVRHGGGGAMLLQLLEDGTTRQLEMVAIDRGLGMRDVAECMRDGYSTAGTPGTGLGAAARLSAAFDLFSQLDKGTVVLSRVARKPEAGTPSGSSGPPKSRLEFGAICIPLAGEAVCGDGWRLAEEEPNVSFLVTDGLGHGPLAAAASRAAAEVFEGRPFDDPASMIQNINQRLTGGRGAVAACARLQRTAGKADYAGVGNISGIIVEPSRSRGMVSLNGTLGVIAPRSRQFDYHYPPDGVVVMHSDGLSARWHLADYPGLSLRHAAVIAGVLYRDFARKRDDATVLVVRHRP